MLPRVSRIMAFIVKDINPIIFCMFHWYSWFFTCRNLGKIKAWTLKYGFSLSWSKMDKSVRTQVFACTVTILGTLCTIKYLIITIWIFFADRKFHYEFISDQFSRLIWSTFVVRIRALMTSRTCNEWNYATGLWRMPIKWFKVSSSFLCGVFILNSLKKIKICSWKNKWRLNLIWRA